MDGAQVVITISTNITHQFESLGIKVHYKSVVGPSFGDLGKNLELANTSKADAVVVYYNGRGNRCLKAHR